MSLRGRPRAAAGEMAFPAIVSPSLRCSLASRLPKTVNRSAVHHAPTQRPLSSYRSLALRVACSASSLPTANLLPSGGPFLPTPASRWLPALVRGLACAAAVGICCSIALSMPTSTTAFASLSFAARRFSAEALAAAVRSAWAGLAAGCLHTLAGADHLAALTPLTIGRSHLRASLLGALWGFGHSTGQLILGLLMVVLKDRFHQLVPALSRWGGTTVGLTLLAIGALGVYESFFEEHHEEEAAAATGVSSSADALAAGVEAQAGGLLAARQDGNKFGLATFATGVVYGLQPDALFVIIPALALPTKLAATAYILMFVLGTVAAMGVYAGVIGATSAAIKRSNSGLTKKLSGAAAFVAIAIGLGVLASGWGISLPWFGVGAH
jgi:hypothetical protein